MSALIIYGLLRVPSIANNSSIISDTEDASETEVCKQEEEFNEKKEQ